MKVSQDKSGFNIERLPKKEGYPEYSVMCAYYNQAYRAHVFRDLMMAQTVPPKEIIFVDDGSSEKLSIERVIPLPHTMNMALITNSGVDACTSDWVMLCSPDFVYPPDFVQKSFDLNKNQKQLVKGVLYTADDPLFALEKVGKVPYAPEGWLIRKSQYLGGKNEAYVGWGKHDDEMDVRQGLAGIEIKNDESLYYWHWSHTMRQKESADYKKFREVGNLNDDLYFNKYLPFIKKWKITTYDKNMRSGRYLEFPNWTFDNWREKYSTLSDAEQKLLHNIWEEKYPDQRHFSVADFKIVLDTVKHFEPKITVAEAGGWKGELAASILPQERTIVSWENHEITGQAVTKSVCRDARYRAIYESKFRWWEDLALTDNFLVMSHFLEHVSSDDCEKLLARIVDWENVKFVYIDAPLLFYKSDKWDNYYGSHINRMTWMDVMTRLVEKFKVFYHHIDITYPHDRRIVGLKRNA
jgi:glycosyltransferase involved in cell wall biosynthesis